MFKDKDTEFGTIGFDRNIITDMVTDAIEGYAEKVWLGDTGVRRLFKNNDEESFIDVEWEDELSVTIYVILKFGTSISMVTDNILNDVKEQLTDAFGDIPMKLKMVVTGVQVREQIAKRHIEVEL